MLDVCLLGTGGMMPLPDRWLTALLLRQNGRMILIDCGEGTQIPIKKAGWGFKAIDAVLFTHYHADHISGLPGLLLTLGNSGRTEPLILTGPPGIKKVVEGLCVISPELPYELRLIELPDDSISELSVSGLLIKSLPVNHNIPCLSYSVEIERQGRFNPSRAKELNIPVKYWSRLQDGETIEAEGEILKPEMVLGDKRKAIKLSYCTDTRPIYKLKEFIEASDLFICEGMYGDNEDIQKAEQKRHMTFSEAAQLAYDARVMELWLTHYSPALTEPEKYIGNATAIFTNSIAASDLTFKTIKWED